jgi:hypothetical protein
VKERRKCPHNTTPWAGTSVAICAAVRCSTRVIQKYFSETSLFPVNFSREERAWLSEAAFRLSC